jgi:hypothetical protein
MRDIILEKIEAALRSDAAIEFKTVELQEIVRSAADRARATEAQTARANYEYERGRAEGALQAIKAFAKGSRRKA